VPVAAAHDRVPQAARGVPERCLVGTDPQELLGHLFTQQSLGPVDAALIRRRVASNLQSELSSFSQIVGSDAGFGVPVASLNIVASRNSTLHRAAYNGRSALVHRRRAH
jgi:hypothetical protein